MSCLLTIQIRLTLRPRKVFRPGPSLVRSSRHVQAMAIVMMPDRRQTKMKWSQVKAKGRGRQRRENNGGKCGNTAATKQMKIL